MEREELAQFGMSGLCVVVGALNPAILKPDWLRTQGILKFDKATLTVPIASTDAMLFFPQFRAGGFQWSCTPNRLEMTSENNNQSPGGIVARILRKLEHTPTTAVGNNFVYKFRPEEMPPLEPVSTPLAGFLVNQGIPVEAEKITLSIGERDAQLNVTLQSRDRKIESISFNFHRVTPTAVEAAEASEKWQSDQARANDVLSAIQKGLKR